MSNLVDNIRQNPIYKLKADVYGKKEVEFNSGTLVGELLGQEDTHGRLYVGALVNNDVVSLQMPLFVNCNIKGLTIADYNGWLIVRRSYCFVMAMVAHQFFKDYDFRICHSLASGVFFVLKKNGVDSDCDMDQALACEFENKLREVIAQDYPILRTKMAYGEAYKEFFTSGRNDKLGLLKHINNPTIDVLYCNGFFDIHHGPVVASTGLMGCFSLTLCENGCVLNLPSNEDINTPLKFRPQKELMRIHKEHAEWGNILGVRSVGELNQAVYDRRIGDVIMMAEALHNKTFAELAYRITHERKGVCLVLIAGPSSAGKTTSAKRLQLHLRVNGYNPVTISTDDYFVGDALNPLGPDGKPDYEHINAIDLKNFNDHLNALLSGETIQRRIFNFKTKKPEISNETLTLGEKDILIVEGIHGLNPILTKAIPREKKFLIYLSALTQLGIDNNTFVSSSDNRLVRRIVRDYLYRGHSALRTLQLWESVRRGEERWIFPYQDSADASFNTALDYELAVLRSYALPLLAEIKPCHKEYSIARRLQYLLLGFHSISESTIPGDSILREYIGGSLLSY